MSSISPTVGFDCPSSFPVVGLQRPNIFSYRVLLSQYPPSYRIFPVVDSIYITRISLIELFLSLFLVQIIIICSKYTCTEQSNDFLHLLIISHIINILSV